MFGIGISEIVMIAILAMVVVGPKRLPGTLRAIGRAIGEFRKAMSELRKEVQFDDVVDEVTRPLREGMAGIEADIKSVDAKIPVVEYPEGGPDDYGALPEKSAAYPPVARKPGAKSAVGDET
jgi:Tat protein translocase TatB subunit